MNEARGAEHSEKTEDITGGESERKSVSSTTTEKGNILIKKFEKRITLEDKSLISQ